MSRVVVTIVALGLWAVAEAPLSAGQTAAPPAAAKPAAPAVHLRDIDKIIAEVKKRTGTAPIDQPLRVMDAGGYNVGVAVVRRTVPETRSLVHDKVTEVYHILEGAGTLMTGGVAVDPQPLEARLVQLAGPGIAGSGGIKAGESRRVSPGDIVIVPAGTPHMFTALDGEILYLMIRIDPEQVLPLQ